MPQSVTSRRVFLHKTEKPIFPVIVVLVAVSSIFPLSSLPFSTRSRAGDPTLPFPFHLPSIAQLRLSPARRRNGGERGGCGPGVAAERSLSRWPPPRNRHSRKCINLISASSIRVLLYFLMPTTRRISAITSHFTWHICAATIYFTIDNR